MNKDKTPTDEEKKEDIKEAQRWEKTILEKSLTWINLKHRIYFSYYMENNLTKEQLGEIFLDLLSSGTLQKIPKFEINKDTMIESHKDYEKSLAKRKKADRIIKEKIEIPTFEEVMKFWEENIKNPDIIDYTEDYMKEWYELSIGRNWHDGKGYPIRDWKKVSKKWVLNYDTGKKENY